MKTELKVIYNTFFFAEELALIRGAAAQEVDLDGRSDAFLKSVAMAVATGILESTVKPIEIVALIKDKDIKIDTEVKLGYRDTGKFVEVAKTEVVEAELVEEDKVAEATEGTAIDLEQLLAGPTGAVANKVKSALEALTADQKEELVALERAGKARPNIISLIK